MIIETLNAHGGPGLRARGHVCLRVECWDSPAARSRPPALRAPALPVPCAGQGSAAGRPKLMDGG